LGLWLDVWAVNSSIFIDFISGSYQDRSELLMGAVHDSYPIFRFNAAVFEMPNPQPTTHQRQRRNGKAVASLVLFDKERKVMWRAP
jgi:hypothetical protein